MLFIFLRYLQQCVFRYDNLVVLVYLAWDNIVSMICPVSVIILTIILVVGIKINKTTHAANVFCGINIKRAVASKLY